MEDQLKKMLSGVSGGRVLDVATGPGSFIGRLAESLADYEEIIGIDVSDKGFEAAQEALSEAGIERFCFQKMDAATLDFPDESFDTVAISNSLHHLPDVESGLREMQRVLKTGGRFILSEMYRDQADTPQQQMHTDFHHWWADVDTLLGVSHNHTFTRQELIDWVTQTDVADLHIEDQIWEIDDPMEEATLNLIAERCDHYCARLADHPQGQPLIECGQALKACLFEIGWGSAKQIIVIARKK